MKLCLCFHCLCESYDDISGDSGELYVSLDDMREMIEQFLARGYTFSGLEDPVKSVSGLPSWEEPLGGRGRLSLSVGTAHIMASMCA